MHRGVDLQGSIRSGQVTDNKQVTAHILGGLGIEAPPEEDVDPKSENRYPQLPNTFLELLLELKFRQNFPQTVYLLSYTNRTYTPQNV